MMERSDKYDYYIENNHGTIAMGSSNNLKSTYKNDDIYDFSRVQTPYSMKLLLQEIEAFGIKPSVYTNNKNDFEDIYENVVLDDIEKDIC
jgi:DNA-directed RNA polymerase beta subunit